MITEKFSSDNIWTLPNRHSQSLEGLDFQACCRASAQTPTAPFWKGTYWENYRKMFPL